MQRVTHGADPGIDGSIMQRMIGEAEQYAPVVENPFQSPVTEPESTVSADVDTASYANVRRFLENNQAPPPGAVRVEEMVNYFSYDYPQPKDDTPFSVDMETASCPWNETHRLVRIGLKAKDIDPAERGPSNLVFLLDVSGSMRDANKLPLVKDAMAMLVDQLTEDDRVSIVTYAGDAGLALEPTEGTERKKILERIEALEAGGSTHGSAGIQMAYDQAMANFVPKGNNRVILCTDGDLNVGITDDDELVKLIQQKASSGVFLTVVGFGTGNLKDAKLEQLADKGNGKYAYVDGLKEAKKVFSEQVSGSLVTVAKDVKIQIEFNPAKVESYRLIGYENRLLAAQDFADDMKDAGEIGAGHSVTFLYEVVPAKLPAGQIAALNRAQENLRYQRIISNALTEVAESGELLALKLRYKLPDEQQSRLLELPVMDSGKRFGEASSEFRFAAAVAAFGMLLRGSQYNQGLTFSAVEEFAAGAADNDREGRRGEFVDLVRRARTLYGDTTQVGADAIMVPSAAAEAAAEEAQAPAARE
jgi:Ca-activated chloride channel family protein